MIIQCPACGARAKLPDSKEGAKVRCAECERVYVAREPGAHRGGSSSKTNPALPIGIGAGVIALGLIFFMTRDRKEAKGIPTLPDKPAPVAQVAVDQIGWNSELVVHVRELHDLAARRENFALSNQISFPHVWARLQYAKGEAPAGSEEEGGIEIPLNLDTSGYEELSSGAIDELRGDVMTFLHSEEGANLPGNWSPFDGEVVSQTDDTALIHLAIEPRNESYGVGMCNIEW